MVVYAVVENREIAREKTSVLNDLKIEPGQYFLETAHRVENVDVKDRLNCIISSLVSLQKHYRNRIIFPMHPRTQKMMQEFSINADGIMLVNPIGYLYFLYLEAHARLVLTDSGGLQEESCILNVPCVTLRENTERSETVDVGANMLAGTDTQRIMDAEDRMLSVKKSGRTRR